MATVESYITLYCWRLGVACLLTAIYIETIFISQPLDPVLNRLVSLFPLVGFIFIFAVLIGDGGVRSIGALYDAYVEWASE